MRWLALFALVGCNQILGIGRTEGPDAAFFDAANASGDESKPWTAPKDMASYKPIFDALWTAFGENRLIWGSNYPVSELGEPSQLHLTGS